MNLVPAAGAGCDHFCSRWLLSELRYQVRPDLYRKLVFLFKRAESARHSATTGIQQSRLASRQSLDQGGHESRVQQRFGVAMGMNGDVFTHASEGQFAMLLFHDVVNELFEQRTALRYSLSL